jgi:hypothetical protein
MAAVASGPRRARGVLGGNPPEPKKHRRQLHASGLAKSALHTSMRRRLDRGLHGPIGATEEIPNPPTRQSLTRHASRPAGQPGRLGTHDRTTRKIRARRYRIARPARVGHSVGRPPAQLRVGAKARWNCSRSSLQSLITMCAPWAWDRSPVRAAFGDPATGRQQPPAAVPARFGLPVRALAPGSSSSVGVPLVRGVPGRGGSGHGRGSTVPGHDALLSPSRAGPGLWARGWALWRPPPRWRGDDQSGITRSAGRAGDLSLPRPGQGQIPRVHLPGAKAVLVLPDLQGLAGNAGASLSHRIAPGQILMALSRR